MASVHPDNSVEPFKPYVAPPTWRDCRHFTSQCLLCAREDDARGCPGGWCRRPDDVDHAAEMMTPVAKHLLQKNMVSAAFVFRMLQLLFTFVFLGLFSFVVLYQADSTNMEDSVSTVSGYARVCHAPAALQKGRRATLEDLHPRRLVSLVGW
jgi:hypothetical protein